MRVYWCGYCGGSLSSPEVRGCPHCGVGLGRVAEGTLEDRRRARKAYAQERRARALRKVWALLGKAATGLAYLVGAAASLCVLAAAAYGLSRLFLPIFRYRSDPEVRAWVSAMTAIVALGLAFYYWTVLHGASVPRHPDPVVDAFTRPLLSPYGRKALGGSSAEADAIVRRIVQLCVAEIIVIVLIYYA